MCMYVYTVYVKENISGVYTLYMHILATMLKVHGQLILRIHVTRNIHVYIQGFFWGGGGGARGAPSLKGLPPL